MSLLLEGIRGFRVSYCFDFDTYPQNLAIFAPNGFGKTGFPDGFEFVTSKNGAIERFGDVENLNLNKSGSRALKNVFTDLDNKDAYVQIEIEQINYDVDENSKQSKSFEVQLEKTKFEFKRLVGEPAEQYSYGFNEFLTEYNVSSLIRGDELKSFVTDRSPVQRFGDVCKSIGQEEAFRALKVSRNTLVEVSSELERVNREVAKLNSVLATLSNQKLFAYNESQILSFLNDELLAPLYPNFSLSKLDLLDSTFLKLFSILEKFEHTAEIPDSVQNDTEVSNLRKILSRVIDFNNLKQEFHKLNDKTVEFKRTINEIESRIEKNSNELIVKVQKVIDQIHEPMNGYYQYIQQDESQTIWTRIDIDEDSGQEQLNLSIDFAPNRKEAQPAGYLSNSQMHSYTLAFRLASIKVLNPHVPILVLDDIVTSYDAQFRFRIANLLAAKFRDFQIILFTHDEQFYQMLIDKMDSKKWKFDRIVRFNRENGPIFMSYEPSEVEMNRLWNNGHSAGHLARMCQERFALGMVKDLRIPMPVLNSNTTRNYPRAQLFQAIAKYLKEAGLVVPRFEGIQRDLLQYFEQGKLENSLLHVNDETFGSISVGDEKERWKEFKKFMGLFTCGNCGHKRFATKGSRG